MGAVVGEVAAGTVEHALPGEAVGVVEGEGGADGDAAVGGVVGEEGEGSATRLAGVVTSPCVGSISTFAHAIAVGGVSILIRVCP